jgi:hypothetical protein
MKWCLIGAMRPDAQQKERAACPAAPKVGIFSRGQRNALQP